MRSSQQRPDPAQLAGALLVQRKIIERPMAGEFMTPAELLTAFQQCAVTFAFYASQQFKNIGNEIDGLNLPADTQKMPHPFPTHTTNKGPLEYAATSVGRLREHIDALVQHGNDLANPPTNIVPHSSIDIFARYSSAAMTLVSNPKASFEDPAIIPEVFAFLPDARVRAMGRSFARGVKTIRETMRAQYGLPAGPA
ncbi:MAG TPA: hypothetical protein VHB73_00385 [Alphaproteobacteria bacterium]|nr:hypothetical protein [Alphaproteobacteria bacterium]